MALQAVVIDHDPTLREDLRRHLETQGIEVVADCADADAGVAAAMRHRPELCLLSADLPEGSIRTTRRLCQAVPDTTVVLLADGLTTQDLLAALRVGANGYLERDLPPEQLARALHGALNGEPAISRGAVTHLLDHVRRPDLRRLTLPGRGEIEFTQREWQILALLRDGRTTTEIADQLYIATVTVRTHIASILRRLDVPDRASAIDLLDRHATSVGGGTDHAPR